MGSKHSRSIARWTGLAAIALPTVHIISTLLLAVLGVSPSHSRWPLLLTFAGVLAIAGLSIGGQSKLVQVSSTGRSRNVRQGRFSRVFRTLASGVSGLASGAILGFFIGGQLGDQQPLWATIGLAIGGLCMGSLSGWAVRQQAMGTRRDGFASFCCSAIALISGLCAYGLTFGLGAWTWMAISAGRLGVAVLLGLLAAFYLWCTRQAIALMLHYLRE